MKKKQKYGIDMQFLPFDLRVHLTSVEAYIANGGVSATKSASSFDELVALAVSIYQIPDFTWSDKFKAIKDLHQAIESIPKKRRKELQTAARQRFGAMDRKGPVSGTRMSIEEDHDRFIPAKSSREQFYRSWDWQTLRNVALKKYGRCCQSCGATPGMRNVSGSPVRIVVDHVQPISTHWHRRLDLSNLQVLCDECNMGKGAWDSTDYRR